MAPPSRKRESKPESPFTEPARSEQSDEGFVPETPPPTAADRRTHPRYEFIAAIEVEDAESGTKIKSSIRDLSEQGCYVDTEGPFPLGTVANVRIKKGPHSFEAAARVVFSQVGKGMGLMFATIEPKHQEALEVWLSECRETSWLAANRRRSQRVLMKIRVKVSLKTDLGVLVEEETHTLAISAHGALLLAPIEVHRGQRLTLSNVHTSASLECVVAHLERRGGQPQVGVEFLLPNPTFWHVTFPPRDWTPRHPDAKHLPRSDGSN
jgi:hypothetical protein